MPTNPHGPLFYRKTSRPVELLNVEPVVKYRVRYSDGKEDVVTQEELDRNFSNERVLATFTRGTQLLAVKGDPRRGVNFAVREPTGFGRPLLQTWTDDEPFIAALVNDLQQWLADRQAMRAIAEKAALAAAAEVTNAMRADCTMGRAAAMTATEVAQRCTCVVCRNSP